MSQEYNTIAKRPRRTRTPRNRPVLVTGNEATEETVPPTTEDLAFDTDSGANNSEAAIAPVATTRSPLRLPKFFSKVEHDKEDVPSNTDGIVEARMARAKKSLNGKAATTAIDDETEVSAKPVAKAKPTAPPKKPQLFKSRHIIGMVLYLFGANLLLPYEATFIKSANLEKNLYTIPGINLVLTTSLVLNIITLVVFLYLLVAFDLLPNGKKLSANQPQQKNGTKTNSVQYVQARTPQPTIRQGVKGDSDDIYQSYRSKQRKRR